MPPREPSVGTASATDPKDDSQSYSIMEGNGQMKFAIDGSSGAVTVASVLDHETSTSYTLTVQADDGHGDMATATLQVSVTDMVEDPTVLQPAGHPCGW